MLDYRDYPELSAEFVVRYPMDDPRFEPWLNAWYGAPVARWYWDREPEDEIFSTDQETFRVFTARSWSMGRTLHERFSSDQVGQTVHLLADRFRLPDLPEQGERMMWNAIGTLFYDVFEPFASDTLCHLSEPNTKLEGALYMFWDVIGWWPIDGAELARAAFPRLIASLLDSPKASVQESAIHGIGEFVNRGGIPGLEDIAQRFIAEGRTSRSELFAYAEKAMIGMIV